MFPRPMCPPTPPWARCIEEIWPRLDPQGLFNRPWEEFRHSDQLDLLHEFQRQAPFECVSIDAGRSVEMRRLAGVEFGAPGGRRVLLWARQHGNEPDCTAALNCALMELARNPSDPAAAAILGKLRLCVLPMVNPDGVGLYTRHNACGVDLNRDAVALSQPESQALVALKDAFKPEFAFNLHDMSPRKSTDQGALVAIAFQAGPFDETGADNPVRLKAKSVIARMAEAAAILAPGGVARYKADYMHRAFGDSMMRWGVACMLLESGGWTPEDGGDDFVRRLHALAILAGLYAIAEGMDAGSDRDPSHAQSYEAIPLDGGRLQLDTLLRGALVHSGAGNLPYTGDLGINHERRHRRRDDHLRVLGMLEALGDLEEERGKIEYDLDGLTALPGVFGMAPGLCFGERLPRIGEVEPFLRAGITTLAASFGPFPTPHDREIFAENIVRSHPPINLVALERVDGVEDILRRQGMTELAGMATEPMLMRGRDLLELIHLYHPANPSVVNDQDEEALVRVEFVFRGAMSPRRTRMHLMFAPARDGDEAKLEHAPASQLRQLAVRFLRHPNQLSFSRAGFGRLPGFLPIQLSPVGFLPGEKVEGTHVSKVLRRFNKGDTGSISMIVNLMTRQMARAFGLDNVGVLRIGMRADLIVMRNAVLDPEKTSPAPPSFVFVNGQPAVVPGVEHTAPVEGVLTLEG